MNRKRIAILSLAAVLAFAVWNAGIVVFAASMAGQWASAMIITVKLPVVGNPTHR